MSDTLPHAVDAPEALRDEAADVMKAARAEQTPDSLGRYDWLEISKKLSAWWKERGYAFP